MYGVCPRGRRFGERPGRGKEGGFGNDERDERKGGHHWCFVKEVLSNALCEKWKKISPNMKIPV